MKENEIPTINVPASTSVEAYMTAARERSEKVVEKACDEFRARGYDDPELIGYVETYFGPITIKPSPLPKTNPNFPGPRPQA